MKYFVLTLHPSYQAPTIKNWQGILDSRTLAKKKKPLIPKHTLFQTNPQLKAVFTDLIFHPCFMVTKQVMDVIKLYEPSLYFERLVLSEAQTKKIHTYCIPILEELSVLTSNSRVGRDRVTLEHIEIDYQKTKGKAIFQMKYQDKVYILANLDLVESLLRRQITGIDLKEVDII